MNGDGGEFLAGQFVEVNCTPDDMAMEFRMTPLGMFVRNGREIQDHFSVTCDRCHMEPQTNYGGWSDDDIIAIEIAHAIYGCNGRIVRAKP